MGLSNFDILKIAKHLEIPNFKGVFTRDQLPEKIGNRESGIVNFNTSKEPGSHWVAYFRDSSKKIYFDSFGQVIPTEIQKYLKTKDEYRNNLPVIERNTDVVQEPNTVICGHLCLYVLDNLSKGVNFQEIINTLW